MRISNKSFYEDGKFALVTGMGCSCFSREDANIDLYPTKDIAIKKFNEWFRRS